MKGILLICLALTFVAFARPSLQLDKDRIEAGKTFGLQLVYPLNELPENRDNLTIETQNGFTFMGLDSSDQVIRPDIEDMFNSFFGGGRNRGGYKARIYTFKLSNRRLDQSPGTGGWERIYNETVQVTYTENGMDSDSELTVYLNGTELSALPDTVLRKYQYKVNSINNRCLQDGYRKR